MTFETLLIAMAAFTLGHLLGWMRRAELERKKRGLTAETPESKP